MLTCISEDTFGSCSKPNAAQHDRKPTNKIEQIIFLNVIRHKDSLNCYGHTYGVESASSGVVKRKE